MFNYHPPYSPDLAPSEFYLFLYFKKFLSGSASAFLEWQRGGDECQSASIKLSIKMGFVSVNGPRKSYFVDALCS